MTPSKRIAAGAKSKKDMIVMMEKRLILSRVSSFLTISFLLNTFRVWFVTFEAIALPKPILLKERETIHPSGYDYLLGKINSVDVRFLLVSFIPVESGLSKRR